MKTKTDKEILAAYIPNKALDAVISLIHSHEINLNIKKSRTTKLGDFRPPNNKHAARLSINYDLNQYAFLITLIHEIAHWLVWKENNNYKRLNPHGKEWKTTFQDLMTEFLIPEIFPDTLLRILKKHMQNPKASSSSDIHLVRELKKYDQGEPALILADLEIGDKFLLKNKAFQIVKKNRSRFLCIDLHSQKKYLVHSLAEIQKATNEAFS